jgi:pimeloyl-ACP methyl ester carboxylesterase
LKPFLDEYTVYILSRKPGLPQGYTTQDMSDDYAELIRGEFGGHVAVVIGVSYGGMIAQHFAADHADLCDHLVIAMSTHKLTEAGARLDTRFAELLSQGKVRQASVVIVEALYPAGIGRWLMSAAMWLLGGSLFGAQPGTYQQDVLIEAKAEVTHDSLESLKRIQAPVLILVGGNDFYFTSQSAEELAAMIPNSTLKIYPGKGHEIMNERRFGQDIAEFIAAHPA